MTRTLLVTPFPPNRRNGRGSRTTSIILALAARGEVDVIYAGFDGSPPDPSLESKGIRLRPIEPSRATARAFLYLRARARGVPKDFARGLSVELLEALRDARGEHLGRVVADGPSAAAALLLMRGERKVSYLAHNLESTLRSQLGWKKRALEELRRFEKGLLDSAEETWLPSDRDLRAAAKLAPGARLRLVPNAIDVSGIAPASEGRGERALFVADFTYQPNLNSARFLIGEVMPKVWERLPRARLALVGRGLALGGKTDPRVEPLGFVEDLRAIYSEAGCVVVPLFESGGSPLKLIEAMAFAVPIVATSLAAGGVDGLEDGVHFLQADGAEVFAAAVTRVLSGGAGTIGTTARKLAESEYSIDALARRLSE